MEDLIEKIRKATITDATDEARAVGADACRTLLIALQAKQGEPMAPPTAIAESALVARSASSAPTPLATAQALISALPGMSPDQLLDVAIARLRAALPPGTNVPTPPRLNVHLVPINRAVSP